MDLSGLVALNITVETKNDNHIFQVFKANHLLAAFRSLHMKLGRSVPPM